jgi:hypothetical protein
MGQCDGIANFWHDFRIFMPMVATVKYLLLAICLTGFLNHATGQKKVPKTDNDIVCMEAKQRALRDHKRKQLKYYAFGIAAPSKQFIDSLKHYHVHTVSLGCTADQQMMCYNAVVDSIVYKLYSVNIHKIR